MEKKKVIIVGAGIVGVSAAIWLQREGHEVVLIDKAGPGEGASHGNGGILASCSIVPVTGPGLVSKAPRMLLDPNQPLFVKWRYLPKLMPWLVRYLSHANKADTQRIASALAPIIGDSLNDHLALATRTRAEKWITPSDFLYMYNDRRHFHDDAFTWSLRKAHGFDWEELEGDAFKQYDPAFADDQGFAAKLPGHGHITDPGRYVKDLAAHVESQGGGIIHSEVVGFVRENGAVTGVLVGGDAIACDEVIIAAGARSKPLCKQLGLDIPLESERGYHLELVEPNMMPRAPVMVSSGKFVVTPMDGRLRLAGIVEYGGLEAKASRGPLKLLRQKIQSVMPGLAWGETVEWMGHRPVPADSIPLIGKVPGTSNAWLGFGHHHIGLTGGPKTGRILSQLAAGKKPNIDLTPYAPSRFQ
ncbi:MAG: FAD-binding oxidoreductase [Pseudomonadota bacterium]